MIWINTPIYRQVPEWSKRSNGYTPANKVADYISVPQLEHDTFCIVFPRLDRQLSSSFQFPGVASKCIHRTEQ